MAWAQRWDIPVMSNDFWFYLEALADFQMGSRSCCKWKIEQHIEDILANAKHFDSGVIFAGDIEDEDRPSTRKIRAEIAAERAEVVSRDAEKHVAWLDKEVVPLLLRLHKGTKYGIMGGVAGHHYTQISAMQNSVQYIYRELERLTGKPCVYLGEMVSFMDLRFKHTNGKCVRQVGLLQHGEGGGQTKSSTINKLDRAAAGFSADFYIRGHDCQLVGTKTDQLEARESRGGEPSIACRTKALLNLGSATMGYEMRKDSTSYIESAMMRPATMGWGTMKFRIRKALKGEDPYENLRADIKLEF